MEPSHVTPYQEQTEDCDAVVHPFASEGMDDQDEPAAALSERMPSTGEGGGLGGEGDGGGGEGQAGREEGRTLPVSQEGIEPQALVPERTSLVRAVRDENEVGIVPRIPVLDARLTY